MENYRCTMTFKIWEKEDGERAVYLEGYRNGESNSYPFAPQEFDRFMEAATATQKALHEPGKR
jgi:hypothetical protein